MKVKIKKLYDDAITPTIGTPLSAGHDLYACISNDITIPPQTSQMIGTGISVEIPQGFFGGIFARSGLSTKLGLRPANCTGVVDADYRDEIKVCLYNDSNEERVIKNGERIAQLVVIPFLKFEFVESDILSDTEREGGFGSTGIK